MDTAVVDTVEDRPGSNAPIPLAVAFGTQFGGCTHRHLGDVGVLHMKLVFPPIYIQHNQSLCRFLLELRATSSAVANCETEIHIANTAR